MSFDKSATRTAVPLCWILLCVTAACQHSRAGGEPARPVPAECRDAMQRATRLGALLFEHDHAAASASDAVQERFGRDERVHGWITLPEKGGITTVFFGDAAGRPEVLYTARGGAITKHEPPEPPGPDVEVRIRALRTAAALPLELRCSVQYNPVVLSAEPLGEAGWLVYFLASTRTPGEMVVGGHVRRLVSQDGSTVIHSKPLSKSCVTLPPPPPGAEFTLVTHVVSPCPVETHVFVAFQHNITLLVATSTGNWTIEATKRTTDAVAPGATPSR